MKLIKSILLVLIFACINATIVYPQAPHRLSYQVKILDNNNLSLQSHDVSIRISIIQGSSDGATVYIEEHQAWPNFEGFVNIEIGSGIPQMGIFENINWSQGPYFIQTESDPLGRSNYETKAISQLLSVPYALYAETSGKVLSTSYNDLTDKPSGINPGDILFWNNSQWVVLPIGQPGQVLQIGDEGLPIWSNEVNNFEDTISRGSLYVGTGSVSSITATSAYCNGYLSEPVTEHGFCWNTMQNPTYYHPHTNMGSGVGGVYYGTISNLIGGTTYYVRAYGYSSGTYAYGANVQFTTAPGLAIVSTTTPTNISSYYATTGGFVSHDGGSPVTSRGVCWNTTGSPTINDSHSTNGSGEGSFTATAYGSGTVYVRAYAINGIGISYGTQKSFSTSLPSIGTNDPNNITCTSATLSGYISTYGGTNVTACGVCYGTSQNPTISGTHSSLTPAYGYIGSTINGLIPNTTYYIRAFATNSIGTAYGTQKSFTTGQLINGTVTISAATNIKGYSAVFTGNVTSVGCPGVSERGVCWGTSSNPVYSTNHISNGSGSGQFTCTITGLELNQVYYVRAYTKNSSSGTYTYSSNVNFRTTLAIGDEYNQGRVVYIYNSSDAEYDPSGAYEKGFIIPNNYLEYPGNWAAAPWSTSSYSSIYLSTDSIIGKGDYNTDLIRTAMGMDFYAAYNCGNYYLPSIDELEKIYLIRSLLGIESDTYLSSTEKDHQLVKAFDFNASYNTNAVVLKTQLCKYIPIEYYSRYIYY